MTKGRVAIASVFAAVAIFIAGQTVSAQYPPPKGNMVCEFSSSKIVITVYDGAGKGVGGQWAFFKLVSGGGSLSTNAILTDGNGKGSATLSGGSGRIVIRAESDGLECSAVAEVLGAVVFTPPSTGDAGLAGQSGLGNAAYGIVALPLLAVAGVALRRRATANQRIDS